MTKTHTSYRLSEEGREYLALLALHYGQSRTQVLERIIREQYQAELSRIAAPSKRTDLDG